MGKLNGMKDFFGKFSKKNNASDDTGEIQRNKSDDYVVEKSRSFSVVSGIISVVAAVVIWLFAVTNGSAVSDKIFSVSLDTAKMPGYEAFVSAADASGFNVVVDSDNTVSFTLTGRKNVVNEVSMDDISVFVDFNKYISEAHELPNDSEQTITLDVNIDTPAYFVVSNVSKTQISVKLVPINKVTN